MQIALSDNSFFYSIRGVLMLLKSLSFSVLLYSVSSLVSAELVDLRNQNPDSLELLSNEVLSNDLDKSDNPYSIVSVKDYKQLNIQPLYTDSIGPCCINT